MVIFRPLHIACFLLRFIFTEHSTEGSAELSITSVDVKGNDGDPFSLICRVLSGTVAGNVNFFRPGNKLVLTCDNKFTLTSCSTVVVGYKLMNAKAAQYKMMIESFNSSFDDGIWTCRDSGGNEATVNISSTRTDESPEGIAGGVTSVLIIAGLILAVVLTAASGIYYKRHYQAMEEGKVLTGSYGEYPGEKPALPTSIVITASSEMSGWPTDNPAFSISSEHISSGENVQNIAVVSDSTEEIPVFDIDFANRAHVRVLGSPVDPVYYEQDGESSSQQIEDGRRTSQVGESDFWHGLS